jgi:uncharacterized protein (DUF1778 family)
MFVCAHKKGYDEGEGERMYTKDKSTKFWVRVSPDDKRLIRRAAKKRGVQFSEFVRESAIKEAKRTLN